MTLRGASEHLGISKNRIWRAVKDGHLPAEEGKFKGQTALTVTEAHLEEWAKTWLTSEELELARGTSKHLQTPREHPGVPHEHLEAPDKYHEVPDEYLEVLEGVYEVPCGTSEHLRSVSSSPERTLREDLVAALERSHHEIRMVERRAIELELQLRQHKMLLTENAESLLEREARVKEAEAKLQEIENTKQAELARLTTELQAAKAKEAEARENETRFRTAEEARKAEAERLKSELEATRHQLAEAQKPSGLFSWLGLRKKRSSPDSATSKAG